MAPYTILCNICHRNFTTTKALQNHLLIKHQQRIDHQPQFSLDGVQIQLPKPSPVISPVILNTYRTWLDGIVESMNSSLNPKAAGKWCRLECNFCPKNFLETLLFGMPSLMVNSVRQVSHWKQPIWKKTATKISYKCFSMDEVRKAFSTHSSVPLVEKKAFFGYEETPDVTLSGSHAIALAKARVRGDTEIRLPTSRSALLVGPGEGRATREFEIIWWPDLYSSPECGKITLRYYIAKC